MATIKWHRSEEGCVHSHCQRFEIWPRRAGKTRTQYYDVFDNQENCVFDWFRTQAQCKVAAQAQLESHPFNLAAEF